MKRKFSKTVVAGLPVPATGRKYTYDEKTAGLAVCVTNKGARTFYVVKKVNGRTMRHRIGRFPEVTVEQARSRAAEVSNEITRGIDPQAQRRDARRELTLGDTFDRWLATHAKLHNKTWQQEERKFDYHLRPWRARRLSTISKEDVRALHARIGKSGGIYSANRVLGLLKTIFIAAVDYGYDGENPTANVRLFREKSRDRFLQPDELQRFFQALADEPNEAARDFFLLSLWTGARRGDVLEMAWADIDLHLEIWRIDETKSGETVIVPLVEPALAVLFARREACNGSHWVFPGAAKGGRMGPPRDAWRRILKRAGIENLRIHDLRRSLGSWQAVCGSSLPVIGRSLGHKSLSATAVYARLMMDPVRESVDRASQAMLAAGGVKNNDTESDDE